MGVDKAIEVFKASPATIRRDFDELARKNLVTRIRGGIKAKPQQTTGKPALYQPNNRQRH